MDTVIIRCKDCGALFYANARLEPEDVLDIVKYSREGHVVSVVDAAVVRAELSTCTCSSGNDG